MCGKVGGVGSRGGENIGDRGGIVKGEGVLRGVGREDMVGIASTDLPGGDFRAIRIFVGSDETFKLLRAGVQNGSNNAPANLLVKVRDETNNTDIFSQSSKRVVGTLDSPVAEKSGPIDVRLSIENTGNSTENNVTGIFDVVLD
jgi:hypothetical protein